MTQAVVNVVIAGLGGQGVVKASDILADAAFRAGHDVKKSEIHGMSQRGGSVASDVRFGERVFSPMVPTGQADYLIVVAPDQVEVNRHVLKAGGVLISPAILETASAKPQQKTINVALLGVLSAYLGLDAAIWEQAVCGCLAEKHHRLNLDAFHLGRACAPAHA